MVQLMLKSGINASGMESMMTVMAESAARLSGKIYPLFSPFIGILGAFMTGSNTVSNILFSSFQLNTALTLGLPALLIVVLQVVGGAIGNMICVNNVIAVSATVGLQGVEGKIIRHNAFPSFIYGILVALLVHALISLGFDPVPLQ